MRCVDEEASSSERPLQFAGYWVIARTTDEASNEIGSAVRIVPDERVNFVVAACRTRYEGAIVVIHLVFPLLVHLLLDGKPIEVGTHENSGAELQWPLRWRRG